MCFVFSHLVIYLVRFVMIEMCVEIRDTTAKNKINNENLKHTHTNTQTKQLKKNFRILLSFWEVNKDKCAFLALTFMLF